MEITEAPLILRHTASGEERTIPAAMDTASLRAPGVVFRPLDPSRMGTWTTQNWIQWKADGEGPEGITGFWEMDDNGDAGARLASPRVQLPADFSGGSIRVEGWVYYATSGEAQPWRVIFYEGDASNRVLGNTVYKFTPPGDQWVPFTYTFRIHHAETRVIRIRVQFPPESGDIPAGDVYRLAATGADFGSQPYPVRWGAAAQKDGHLEGFWSTPPTVGELKPNAIHGGGLAPGNTNPGVRAVNYIAYCAAVSLTSLREAIKDLTSFLQRGGLAVSHHGLGWCSGGFLAAPPEVEWLTNDFPAARITWTLSFIEPAIVFVDWSDPAQLGAILGTQTPEDTTAYTYSGHLDVSTKTLDDTVEVTLVNTGEATTWPVVGIWFGPSGGATGDATRADVAGLSARAPKGAANDSLFLMHDTNETYTSWMLDGRSGLVYGGITHEDGYMFEPLPAAGTLVGSWAIGPGESFRLKFQELYGVGQIAALAWTAQY